MGDLRRLGIGIAALLLVAAAAFGLQSATLELTHSADCDEPTAADLECAIARDWRAQSAAREDGPGVILGGDCKLRSNIRWPNRRNEDQLSYRLHDISLDGLSVDGTVARVELIRAGNRSPLAYHDSWSWSEGGWSSAACTWEVGNPRHDLFILDFLPPGVSVVDIAPLIVLDPEPVWRFQLRQLDW